MTGDQLDRSAKSPTSKFDEAPESIYIYIYGVLPSGSSASTTRFLHFFLYFRKSLSILAGRFARFQGFSLTNTHDVPHIAKTDACQANLAGII